MPHFFDSLRFRLLLLVLLSALPALAVTVYTGLEQRQQAAEWVKQDTLRLVRLAASGDNAIIEGARQLLVSLAALPQIRTDDLLVCNDYLAGLIRQYPNYIGLDVVAADGSILCSSTGQSEGVNVADRQYFQHVLTTRRFVIGEYTIGPASNEPLLPLAYPVLNEAGIVERVVMASVNMGWLSELAGTVEWPEQAALLVVDSAGVVIARSPEPELWVGQDFSGAPIIQEILSQQIEGTAETAGIDGVNRLYAFTSLLETDPASAFVSIGIPTEFAYAQANRNLIRNMLVLGLVAVVALGSAWTSGNLLILRPVKSIVTATRYLTEGNLQARTGLAAGKGELGRLAAAFDQMADTLQERENQIRQAEIRYRTLVEQIPAITYLSALDEPYHSLYISPQVEKILGVQAEAWLADPEIWHQGLHPEDCDQVRAQLAHSRNSGEPFRTEYRFLASDGRLVWLRDEAAVIRDANGRPLLLQGIMVDITGLKMAQEAVKVYMLQLERSNRELQDFAYIASHDLQEPLRKIQAFGERLASKFAPSLDQEGLDYLERMRNSAARMQSLVNDLLIYSRVTTKAKPFAPVDLQQVLTDVIGDLEERIRETGGHVEASNLPVLSADRTQMYQLFQNLIGNALKFHREGTPPVVKVTGAFVQETPYRKMFEICVKDNGIGFDEKYSERIFLPFQRLHGRDKYSGSGIGLSICRKIVERHNGSLVARSKPGEGTTFLFTLPMQ